MTALMYESHYGPPGRPGGLPERDAMRAVRRHGPLWTLHERHSTTNGYRYEIVSSRPDPLKRTGGTASQRCRSIRSMRALLASARLGMGVCLSLVCQL